MDVFSFHTWFALLGFTSGSSPPFLVRINRFLFCIPLAKIVTTLFFLDGILRSHTGSGDSSGNHSSTEYWDESPSETEIEFGIVSSLVSRAIPRAVESLESEAETF